MSKDQNVLKGISASDLAFTSLVAPYTALGIMTRLQQSAAEAAKQWVGGKSGTLCGQSWDKSKWDVTANRE